MCGEAGVNSAFSPLSVSVLLRVAGLNEPVKLRRRHWGAARHSSTSSIVTPGVSTFSRAPKSSRISSIVIGGPSS